jgi:hypothetical protein
LAALPLFIATLHLFEHGRHYATECGEQCADQQKVPGRSGWLAPTVATMAQETIEKSSKVAARMKRFRDITSSC